MKRILIVDDDSDVRRYCQVKLAVLNHEVWEANSVDQALEIVQRETFDLMIVDIVMPEKSGFDLMRELKKIPHFRSKLLMLTGRKASQDVLTALELGAIDYVCKPIQKGLLVSKVQALLASTPEANEISFPSGSPKAVLVVCLDCVLISLSTTGLKFYYPASLSSDTSLRVASALFREIGIPAPLVRVENCMPAATGATASYLLTGSFIGLEEIDTKKIRDYVLSRLPVTKKAA